MIHTLLDTCAYSRFKRGSRLFVEAVNASRLVFLSPIVLGELKSGFLYGDRREANEVELSEFLRSPQVGVLDIGANTSSYYAAISDHLKRTGTPIPTNDIWIAASAMEHGLRILTSDRHFLKVPQVLVNCIR